jgi:aspartyl-tRNA(Asn)/glutamyl-tRNA(Gln) amidotransferase subunit C
MQESHGAKTRRITIKEVEHAAALAKIELAEGEKAQLTEQLDRMLDYFHKIDQINLTGVPPAHHVIELINVFRSDSPQRTLPRKKALSNASKVEENFFKAPRIV